MEREMRRSSIVFLSVAFLMCTAVYAQQKQPTPLQGPHEVRGNLDVNGRVLVKGPNGLNAPIVTAQDVTSRESLNIDDCFRHIKIEGFDFAKHQIEFDVKDKTKAGQPIFLTIDFFTSTTYKHNDCPVVIAGHGEVIVSPQRPARSIHSSGEGPSFPVSIWNNLTGGEVTSFVQGVDLALTGSQRHTNDGKTVIGLIRRNVESGTFYDPMYNSDTGQTTAPNNPFEKGTLLLNITSPNISGVRITTTWDRPLTLISVLENFTEKQLMELLDILLALFPGQSSQSLKDMTRDQLIDKLLKHEDKIKENGLLKRYI